MGDQTMRIVSRAHFFLLGIAICFHFAVRAAHNQSCGYKMPDLRRQQQQVRNTVKHLKKIGTAPTARFERRHPIKFQAAATSKRQKMLALFFAAMMINAEVILSVSMASKTPKNPTFDGAYIVGPVGSTAQSITPGSVPSVEQKIVSCMARGREAEIFGPCGTLSDGSKYCCEMGANFTATCCAHPDTPMELPRCASFTPWGDNSKSSPINTTAAFLADKKACAARSDTYPTATYFKMVLAQLKERMLRFPEARILGDRYDTPLTILNHSCTVRMTDISHDPNFFSHLQYRVIKLSRAFNVRTPHILIYDDEHCDFHFGAAKITGTVHYADGSQKELREIAFAYTELLENSDDQLADTLGHELGHFKQPDVRQEINGRTGINSEVEADMLGVLARNNSCLAVSLNPNATSLPPITRKNIHELAKGHEFYPTDEARIAVSVALKEFYWKAQRQLLGSKVYEIPLINNRFGEISSHSTRATR